MRYTIFLHRHFFRVFFSRIIDCERCYIACTYLFLRRHFFFSSLAFPSLSRPLCLSRAISPAGSARFRALSNCTRVSCISKLETRSTAARSGESNCIESIGVQGTELSHPRVHKYRRALNRNSNVARHWYAHRRFVLKRHTYFAKSTLSRCRARNDIPWSSHYVYVLIALRKLA